MPGFIATSAIQLILWGTLFCLARATRTEKASAPKTVTSLGQHNKTVVVADNAESAKPHSVGLPEA